MARVDAALISRVVERFGKDPQRLMDIVREVHGELGHVSEDAVDSIAGVLGIHRVQVADMASFYSFFDREPGARYTVRLSNCVVDKMNGMQEVAAAFEKAVGVRFGQTTPDGQIGLRYTSCTGMCDQAPAALINGLVVTGIKPADVPAIVEALKREHGKVGGSVLFPNAEVQLNLRQAGPVVLGPFENGSAIRKSLALSAEQVIDEINKSKLRGRGGAGFPTGMKWSFCRKAKGRHYLICNADEGEPGTFKDRVLLTEVADLLFEGMTVAGYALGADEGLLYLRAEYAYLWPRLEQVLARRRRHGLLGQNIAGREGFDFDIRIQMGAGAYVCGEESALIESLEGKRGAPRDRPPFPVQRGYLEPTSVNNVETLCCAARIMEKGADWFAARHPGLHRHQAAERLRGLRAPRRLRGGVRDHRGQAPAAGRGRGRPGRAGGRSSGACLAPKDYGRKISFEDIPTGGSIIVFGPEAGSAEARAGLHRVLRRGVLRLVRPLPGGHHPAEDEAGEDPGRQGHGLRPGGVEAAGHHGEDDEPLRPGAERGQPGADHPAEPAGAVPQAHHLQGLHPHFDITDAFSEQAAVTGRKFVDHEEAHA